MMQLSDALYMVAEYFAGCSSSRLVLADMLEDSGMVDEARRLRVGTHVLYQFDDHVSSFIWMFNREYRIQVGNGTFDIEGFVAYLDKYLEDECKYFFFTAEETEAFCRGFRSHDRYRDDDDFDFLNIVSEDKNRVILEILSLIGELLGEFVPYVERMEPRLQQGMKV